MRELVWTVLTALSMASATQSYGAPQEASQTLPSLQRPHSPSGFTLMTAI